MNSQSTTDSHTGQQAALRAALQHLPAVDPPADGWTHVRERVLRQRRRRSRLRGAVPLAAAATLLLALLAGGARFMHESPHSPVAARTSSPGEQATASSATRIIQLQRTSMRLENWLGELRDTGAPLQGAALTRAVQWQDRIGLIDLQLAAPSDDDTRRTLWRQRVDALQNLATLRISQAGLSAQPVVAENRPAAYRL